GGARGLRKMGGGGRGYERTGSTLGGAPFFIDPAGPWLARPCSATEGPPRRGFPSSLARHSGPIKAVGIGRHRPSEEAWVLATRQDGRGLTAFPTLRIGPGLRRADQAFLERCLIGQSLE